MQRLEISTDVYLPPADVYEFLLNFPRYARYSEYLDRVEQYGDGGPGTEYDLVFSWWKLSYTARSEVTDVDEPRRIDWRTVKDIEANGYWRVEPAPDRAPEGVERASEVFFVVELDTESARGSAISIPSFISFDSVLDRVIPKIQAEGRRVVERVVADLEGQQRDIELRIHETPSL
ncbi:SRPBCC family protein [Halovenus aranensis]|uniref:SRPBCC family protein n=1 Tax=Halovenus aranensis TaxID=890420 RepID=UPI000B8915DF|nr:SRPBCC family protein [Halovenus aranensis]